MPLRTRLDWATLIPGLRGKNDTVVVVVVVVVVVARLKMRCVEPSSLCDFVFLFLLVL